ncbi:hypothetical protein LZ575_15395 [Antarcticibacterium sp. 1MA-6-2]|uniref:hypothetical protein n=1 Tax=Antarcticibacterium sp. 1MA-6-2 TaxID=2908210 RepID=UPI001F31FC93|nr:hypothetical protein [Antarcticibacterium sp. 1MA-6-2]UJH90250.1 hypothetical protein LZ575_15395 [Antarcticibacterium sp. 1MA-6-2]
MLRIKILLLVFTSFLITGCSGDDDSGDIMQNLAAVVSVEMPEEFEEGSRYDLHIVYERPTSCHTFSGLDISEEGNKMTIGVVTSFLTNNNLNCVDTGNLQATATINFVAEQEEFYIFRFWKGRNAAGRDEFLIFEIPVTPPGTD